MGQFKTSYELKAEKASKLYPKEFKVLNDKLFCDICKCHVNCEKN